MQYLTHIARNVHAMSDRHHTPTSVVYCYKEALERRQQGPGGWRPVGQYAGRAWVWRPVGQYAGRAWVCRPVGQYAGRAWVWRPVGQYAGRAWVWTTVWTEWQSWCHIICIADRIKPDNTGQAYCVMALRVV